MNKKSVAKRASGSEFWFEAEVRRQRRHERSSTHQAVSWQWGHTVAHRDRDRLYDLLTTVRNFCRLMDVPRDTVIRIASCDEVGTACAGFYDSPGSFLRPFIIIDEGIFERCEPHDCMDVAVGLAIHEAMHILISRDAYLRMADPARDTRLNSLENLLEDWRIEEVCRQEFPGYSPYLYKLRRVLILDMALRKALSRWGDLPDTDKIMAIVGAYIRAPTLLVDVPELMDWTDLQDRNIYQYLRTHLGRAPVSEKQVETMAKRLLDLFDDYCEKSLGYLTSHNKLTLEKQERIRKQELADELDQAFAGHSDLLVRGRFSISDLTAAQVMDNTVRKGSSEITLARINELDREHSHRDSNDPIDNAALPEQRIPSEIRGKIELLRFPRSATGKSEYESAVRRVRSEISRLKHAFPVEDGGKGVKGNRTSGKLDRKRLFRARFDQAIFSEVTTEEPGKVLVALLIDASGSMSEGGRYQRAVQMAAMFNEAFIGHPHIHLQIYSHTSSAGTDKCELSYHGEASVRARESIGSIYPKISNYDYQAIWGVVAHQAAQSEMYARRILISVSDGRPCVPSGSNSSGVEATRKAVEDIRRQGWTVCGVGIGAYYATNIYGERWTLNVPHYASLPTNLSSLLVRLLRR